MRVEGIEPELAKSLASQVSYLEMKGFNNRMTVDMVSDNTGTRALQENGWRSQDLYEVLRLLELSKPDNKFMVLRLLDYTDLIEVLRLLDKEMLVFSLRFFSKEKLMRLMAHLPKELLIKMLLSVMRIEDLVEKMPTAELFRILRSFRLPTRELVKGFYHMPARFLNFLLYKVSGQDMSHLTHDEKMRVLMNTKKRQLLQAMKFLPWKALIPLVNFFAQRDPILLMHMSDRFIFKQFDAMQKSQIMQTFYALPENMIIELFLANLPTQHLVMAAAQVDPSVLQAYLLSEQPNLLAQLAA